MIKKTLIVFASVIVVAILYNFYCDHFWKNYWKSHAFYDLDNQKNDQSIFRFTPNYELPSDTILSNEVLMRYQWSRQLVEPDHAQWINDVELFFESDSIVFYRITAHYISQNYWTYPLFRKFRCNEDGTYTHRFDFDKQKMSFYNHRQDTVKIKFDNNNLIIDHVFL